MQFFLPPDPVLKDALFAHIPGYPGYGVSSDGRIWSCVKKGNTGAYMLAWRVLKDHQCNYHRYVGLRGCTRSVHRLVLEAFVGPCPKGMEGSHIDGNAGNNTLENLCWETPSQNNQRKRGHGTRQNGENSTNRKLTWFQVRVIRSLHKRGLYIKTIARMYGMSDVGISHIIHQRNWVE